ncbi:MAG: tetratricopeptide repeat protein, partial [Phycisphaerales bacterium]
ALIEAYAAGSPLADNTKLTATGRSLRQNVPSSRVLRMLQAQDSMSRSLWSVAEQQLLLLMDANYESPKVLELLVTLWERAAKSDPELSRRGEQWLRARLATRQESTLLIASLARVLVATGEPQKAEQLLADRASRWPIPELARLREAILRENLDRATDADALTQARLSAAPPTVSTAMEWFSFLASKGDFEGAAEKLGALLPAQTALPPEALVRIGQGLGRLSASSVISKGEPACRAVAALFSRVIRGKVSLPASAHAVRLEILSKGVPREPAWLTEAVRDFAVVQPDLEDEAVNQVLAWVSEAATADAALAFLIDYTLTHPSPPADLIAATALQTGNRGTLRDAERVVRELRMTETVRSVMSQLVAGSLDPKAKEPEVRAELAYAIALGFGARDLESEARSLYRLALELDPSHGWSANNLGYSLVEKGEDLAEGERLLEVAIADLPDEGSVLDSLAWLRYLQGRIEDFDRAGAAMPGALTLIQRATSANQSPSAEVLDHAGDIHWKAGRRDEARDFWRKSAAEADFEAGRARERRMAETQLARYAEIRERAKAKESAAADGREPSLGGLAPR